VNKNKRRFSLFQYPFLFTIKAKRKILQMDSEKQMIYNAKVTSTKNLNSFFFKFDSPSFKFDSLFLKFDSPFFNFDPLFLKFDPHFFKFKHFFINFLKKSLQNNNSSSRNDILASKSPDVYLTIRVNRNNIVSDSMNEVISLILKLKKK
jgi:hypothetical protein